MVIRKEYNIGQLVEQLQTEIEKSKKYNRIVKLDILTANDILDVLNETNKRTESRDVENEWYECTGCYDGMSLRCRVCEMKYYCKYEKGSCNE